MTDLPYRDNCNESELYSRESFTENWSGSTENSYEDASEDLKYFLDMARRVRSGLKHLDHCLATEKVVPTFSSWTFYDENTGKIHASFYSTKSLAAFLRSEDFPVFWYAMTEEKHFLRLFDLCSSGYGNIVLKYQGLELVPSKTKEDEWQDMPFTYPIEWILHNRSTTEVNVDEIIEQLGDIVTKGNMIAKADECDENFLPF